MRPWWHPSRFNLARTSKRSGKRSPKTMMAAPRRPSARLSTGSRRRHDRARNRTHLEPPGIPKQFRFAKRLSWPRTKTAVHKAMFGQDKDYSNKIYSTANRVRQQDVVLDCPRRGSLVVLPRAIRGRTRGACLCAVGKQPKLEKAAPRGAESSEDNGGSRNRGCHRGLKWWQGPSRRRSPQRRARWRP